MNTSPDNDTCDRLEADLVELADDALPAARRGAALAHLAACSGCRGWFAEYRSIAEGLAAAIPPLHASAGFEASLRERLGNELRSRPSLQSREQVEQDHRRGLESLRSEFRTRIFQGALSAAGLVLVSVWVVRLLWPQLAALTATLPPMNIATQGTAGLLIALSGLAATRWLLGGLRLR